MSEPKHSPTPFATEGDGMIRDAERNHVAVFVGDIRGDLPFIITAVNSHAALLAACKAAKEELRLLQMKDTGAVYDPTVRTLLDVAIAKAEGGGK